ncbi:hypothetical protein DFH11DRAFT_1572051 [Phellopilus nigrolimitatus]|nr:hypothetical protein DFH11DRAFT_1621352 [Phellopilus nigrolimitatus]KAH8118045.1 hypothetical protein DFH11DRAFT_1572051 [Phellopilus nigrolimitatus]
MLVSLLYPPLHSLLTLVGLLTSLLARLISFGLILPTLVSLWSAIIWTTGGELLLNIKLIQKNYVVFVSHLSRMHVF